MSSESLFIKSNKVTIEECEECEECPSENIFTVGKINSWKVTQQVCHVLCNFLNENNITL